MGIRFIQQNVTIDITL